MASPPTSNAAARSITARAARRRTTGLCAANSMDSRSNDGVELAAPQGDPEGRPFLVAALHLNTTAVCADNFADEVQAQAQSFCAGRSVRGAADEGLEQSLRQIRFERRPRVPYVDHHVVRAPAQLDPNRGARGAMLHGVDQELRQDQGDGIRVEFAVDARIARKEHGVVRMAIVDCVDDSFAEDLQVHAAANDRYSAGLAP